MGILTARLFYVNQAILANFSQIDIDKASLICYTTDIIG